MLSSPLSPFPFFLVVKPDAGLQEPDANFNDDSYYAGSANYYVEATDDDQE